jgi:hypothetical protein
VRKFRVELLKFTDRCVVIESVNGSLNDGGQPARRLETAFPGAPALAITFITVGAAYSLPPHFQRHFYRVENVSAADCRRCPVKNVPALRSEPSQAFRSFREPGWALTARSAH